MTVSKLGSSLVKFSCRSALAAALIAAPVWAQATAFTPLFQKATKAHYAKPGAEKREALAPDARKKLIKNSRVPADLLKKLSPFPSELTGELKPACDGCKQGLIGDTAVIVDKGGILLDSFVVK
jgi:hypothetical protein